LWELRQAGFPVATCFIPFESAAHWLVVAVKRDAYGNAAAGEKLARELGAAIFRSRTGSFIPKVILVEDDIDPANLAELVWAFATRNHPERGQILFHDEKVLPLVAFLSDEERRQARGTKVLYNCLPLEDCTPDKAPRRSSFRFAWPASVQERVLENWKRYGFS
jgi:4-hydroxy-3-polyprenylbenzoate decarboxylase